MMRLLAAVALLFEVSAAQAQQAGGSGGGGSVTDGTTTSSNPPVVVYPGSVVSQSGSNAVVTISGVASNPGGTPNQINYNLAGTTFGGFTMSGDCTIVVATGVLTCTKINGNAVSLGGAFTTGGALT